MFPVYKQTFMFIITSSFARMTWTIPIPDVYYTHENDKKTQIKTKLGAVKSKPKEQVVI